jgi:3-hydroxyisobutyrate dehydrogenase-like beta-hydroxyacid dehydrogenase
MSGCCRLNEVHQLTEWTRAAETTFTEIAMRIGNLGVGKMGQPMAEKLLDAGHELWLYDVREDAMRPLLERQAHRAPSARELADASDTIVVSLPTLATFREAVTGQDGLLSGKALKTLINTCTASRSSPKSRRPARPKA